jgi:hypothetical protein
VVVVVTLVVTVGGGLGRVSAVVCAGGLGVGVGADADVGEGVAGDVDVDGEVGECVDVGEDVAGDVDGELGAPVGERAARLRLGTRLKKLNSDDCPPLDMLSRYGSACAWEVVGWERVWCVMWWQGGIYVFVRLVYCTSFSRQFRALSFSKDTQMLAAK